MASQRPLLASLTGILLLLLGVLRVLGGFALLIQGAAAAPETTASPETIRHVGFLAAALGLFVVLAGWWVLRHRRGSWILAQAALVIFVAGGLLSSRFLFGHPRLLAAAGDILVALVIYASLARVQRTEE